MKSPIKIKKTLKKFTNWLGPGGSRITHNAAEFNEPIVKRIWPDGTWKRSTEIEKADENYKVHVKRHYVYDTKTEKWSRYGAVVTGGQHRDKYLSVYDNVARSVLHDVWSLECRGEPPPERPDGWGGMASSLMLMPMSPSWLPSYKLMKRVEQIKDLDPEFIEYMADELRAMGKLLA